MKAGLSIMIVLYTLGMIGLGAAIGQWIAHDQSFNQFASLHERGLLVERHVVDEKNQVTIQKRGK